MDYPLSVLADGLLNGLLLGLVSLGYFMVYGSTRILNFAHGEVVTIAAYAALLAVGHRSPAVGLGVALGVGACAGACSAVLIQTVFYRPLRGRGRMELLIVALAASAVLRTLLTVCAGGFDRVFPTRDLQGSLFAALPYVSPVLLVLGIHLFLKKTTTGLVMRSLAEKPGTAALFGHDEQAVIRTAFLLGGVLAGVGGVFWAMKYNLRPDMGSDLGIKAFASSVVGGIGSLRGTLVAALGVGLLASLATAIVGGQFRDIVVYAAMAVVLACKPRGLFS